MQNMSGATSIKRPVPNCVFETVQFANLFSKLPSCGAGRSSPLLSLQKKISTNLRFEGWILETILLSTISTLQNANWSKNKKICSDRSGLLRRAPQLDGLENEFANCTVQKTQIGTGRLMLVAPDVFIQLIHYLQSNMALLLRVILSVKYENSQFEILD